MRFGLIVSLFLFASAPLARGCPEVLLPIDRTDPVFTATVWRAPLSAWTKGNMPAALKGLRKVGKRLELDVARLFNVGADGKTAKNAAIQKFLETTVYARPPALSIDGDHFTFPLPVLWAWADAACREGQLDEASAALGKVERLREGADVRAHRLALALRQGRTAEADALLRDLPPDAFLTPFAEARLAMLRGDRDAAREKFTRAKLAALLPERSRLIETWLLQLGASDSTPPSPAPSRTP